MNAQQLNDNIALQLGRLMIENEALRLQLATLQAQLSEKSTELAVKDKK